AGTAASTSNPASADTTAWARVTISATSCSSSSSGTGIYPLLCFGETTVSSKHGRLGVFPRGGQGDTKRTPSGAPEGVLLGGSARETLSEGCQDLSHRLTPSVLAGRSILPLVGGTRSIIPGGRRRAARVAARTRQYTSVGACHQPRGRTVLTRRVALPAPRRHRLTPRPGRQQIRQCP